MMIMMMIKVIGDDDDDDNDDDDDDVRLRVFFSVYNLDFRSIYYGCKTY